MNSGPSEINILADDPADWARAHPSMFFTSGFATQEALTEQLALGARTLCCSEIEVLSLGAWSIVASGEDWFANSRLQTAEESILGRLQAFPELGQNCTRPEFLVLAFCRDVIVLGPQGLRVAKGNVEPTDPAFMRVAGSSIWRRAIAFRGLHA